MTSDRLEALRMLATRFADWTDEPCRKLVTGLQDALNEIDRMRAERSTIATKLEGVVEHVRARKGTDSAMKLAIGDWAAIKAAIRLANGEDER